MLIKDDESKMGNAKSKSNVLTSLSSLNSHIFVATLLVTCGLQGQSRANLGSYAPLPDPGYGLYYQDSAGAPNVASRWGYNDGWEDGRHDRNHGDTAQVQEKDKYTIPPDHGVHPGVTRDQYIRIYRQAYTHGYEHGSRI